MNVNRQSMQDEKDQFFANLVGARLTSVQFIMSYLILGIDEKGAITTMVWPQIETEEKKTLFGMPGYRDALCRLIGKKLTKSKIDSHDTISFEFEDLTNLSIPLQSYEAKGERAIVTGPKHYLLVL